MKVSPRQAAWFRLRRSGLVEPLGSPEETAGRLLGVQAQLPPAADLAFWNRTAGCSLQGLRRAQLERRSLVRLWGQRNTLHLYRTADWPLLHAAFQEHLAKLERYLRQAGLLSDFLRLAGRIGRRLRDGHRLTHRDVRSKKLEGAHDRLRISYAVFLKLVRDGLACHGGGDGGEATFVHRQVWAPDLEWDPPQPEAALAEVARRYLATYGPAEVRDLAFWYGTTLTRARSWIDALGSEAARVDVDGRPHWCRRADLEELGRSAPAPSRWPARLLYRYDPLLLATRDKSWLIAEEHYKKVWRPSAQVAAVLLVRGGIAGTWRYDRRPKGLAVTISPFHALTAPVRRALQGQAEGIAAFLGTALSSFASRNG